MIATAFFGLLTLLSALILVIFLLRAGAARPMTVWALSALLPVLAAMTAANAGQARANRVLTHYAAQREGSLWPVVVHTGGRDYAASLDFEAAACLERAQRLQNESNLEVLPSIIPIRRDTTIDGALPRAEVVGAMSLRGQLGCQQLKALKKRR